MSKITDKEKEQFQKVPGMSKSTKKKTLKEQMKEKIWNLHIETREWEVNLKKPIKEIEGFLKEYKQLVRKWKVEKKVKYINKEKNKIYTQTGKIIFMSWLLTELGEKKLVDKIWKVRRWKMSKNGDRIIKDRSPRG